MHFPRTLLGLSLLAGSSCLGATLSAGDHQIRAMAGQQISIRISDGETIQAIQLLVSIQAGGPRPTDMDPRSGTVLQASTVSPDPAYIDGNQVYTDYGMQFGASALADGLAATVTLDATGLAAGSVFTIHLRSELAASHVVASPDVVTTLVSGTVTIVAAEPGPGSAAGDGGHSGSADPNSGTTDGSDLDTQEDPAPVARFENLRQSSAEENSSVGTPACGSGASQGAAMALFALAAMHLWRHTGK